MHWLLKLYPQAWRERYEEEMLALLEEHHVTPMTIIDLLIGAVDASLYYEGMAGGMVYVMNRIRSAVVMVFCAFMVYGVGWALLQRMNDPLPEFQTVNQLHPEFGVLHNGLFLVGCMSFLAFLIGGLPLFFIAVKRAVQKRQYDVLVPFWTALTCLLLFVACTAVLAAWHPVHHIPIYLIGYLALSALFFVIGIVAVSLVIARAELHLSDLKFVFIPEVAIVFGMAASVILSIVFMIVITAHAPRLFTTQDVSGSMFIAGILCMALGTVFAAMGMKRGWLRPGDTLKDI